jgi:hypothetical protein
MKITQILETFYTNKASISTPKRTSFNADAITASNQYRELMKHQRAVETEFYRKNGEYNGKPYNRIETYVGPQPSIDFLIQSTIDMHKNNPNVLAGIETKQASDGKTYTIAYFYFQ